MSARGGRKGDGDTENESRFCSGPLLDFAPPLPSCALVRGRSVTAELGAHLAETAPVLPQVITAGCDHWLPGRQKLVDLRTHFGALFFPPLVRVVEMPVRVVGSHCPAR